MELGKEQWELVRRLFDEAMELPVAARAGFADRVAADPAINAELMQLLANEPRAADQFISSTASLHYITEPLGNRYRLLRELGAGGSGTVYLAEDLKFENSLVVVKILHTEHRVRREIGALKRLEGVAGIVAVTDRGEAPSGQQFLVMQYVPGSTLEAVIASGPLTLDRATALLQQIADAVEIAHQYNILHRDLKPTNIMIRTLPEGREQAVVIDFGVAALLDTSAASRGTIAGTPGYWAPEQQLGRSCRASDQYALGIIATEMLAGAVLHALPRDSRDIPSLLEHLRAERPELPDHVFAALERATSADFNLRFTRIADFIMAFTGHAAAPTRRSRRTVFATIAAAAVLTAGIGVSWMGLTHVPSPTRLSSAPAPTPAPPVRPLSIRYTVQRLRGDVADGAPFDVPMDYRFRETDGLRIFITAPDAGMISVWNEIDNENRLVPLVAERPIEAAGVLSVPVASGELIRFQHAGSAERVWLVWSRQPIPGLTTAFLRATAEKPNAQLRVSSLVLGMDR